MSSEIRTDQPAISQSIRAAVHEHARQWIESDSQVIAAWAFTEICLVNKFVDSREKPLVVVMGNRGDRIAHWITHRQEQSSNCQMVDEDSTGPPQSRYSQS
jgi:hypothetical protein